MELMKICDIKPYANNPRKNDKAVKSVAESIKEFGFQQPIVVDKNNVIIVGHTRYKASLKIGLTEVPVIVADNLSEEKVKAYRLIDNKTNEIAEWDVELLANELKEIETYNMEMATFGFEKVDKPSFEDDFDIDDAMPETPTTKSGDVWKLGNHRMICGDSTDKEIIKKLMDGKQADMVLTDPPYNIDYIGKTEQKLKIKNDNMTDNEFVVFLTDAFSNMYENSKCGASIYCFCADTERYNFKQHSKERVMNYEKS